METDYRQFSLSFVVVVTRKQGCVLGCGGGVCHVSLVSKFCLLFVLRTNRFSVSVFAPLSACLSTSFLLAVRVDVCWAKKKTCENDSETLQPMEIYVDDETKLTLHGLQQYYIKLAETEKNRKLNDLLDLLDFNQVIFSSSRYRTCLGIDRGC